ncbi:DUF1707 and DUF4190 domain-containing protein [Thermasporomyces composti]|uniref:DUF1707 and DUF4190 domain-containing protein n=1 Tax=Thermasporomyces composti TaxID=696763 RepID=UPI000E280CEA|nr:DUF1707 and DUF4190 domain-containing protein [Thermasporomyces composti]
MTSNWHSMRASNADRERTADVLKAAHAEGRLDWGEYQRRLDQALRAKTYGELQALVSDLPSGPTPLPAASSPTSGPVVPAVNPWATYRPVPVRETEPLAKASLILGALSPFLCSVTSVPAIITGHLALARIAKSGDAGRGMAIAGLIFGYVVTGFSLLWLMFVFLAAAL